MQVIDDARARAFTEVQSDVEPFSSCRGAQKHLRVHYQIPKLDDFVFAKRRYICRFSVGHRHQVANRVGITVHHQKCVLAASDH